MREWIPWRSRDTETGQFLPKATRVNRPAPHWGLEGLSPGDVIVIRESLGTRFGGEIEPTVAFVLDQWAQQGDGMRFRAFAGPGEPCNRGRAGFVVERCFVSTLLALQRWAVAEFAGELETAVRHALREHLDRLGLSAAVDPRTDHA